uniref:START domain-containing protein n=1 Tax=Oryza glumipatula TaxID=40148 RepID=A0A0E0B0Z2_9ORYZ
MRWCQALSIDDNRLLPSPSLAVISILSARRRPPTRLPPPLISHRAPLPSPPRCPSRALDKDGAWRARRLAVLLHSLARALILLLTDGAVLPPPSRLLLLLLASVRPAGEHDVVVTGFSYHVQMRSAVSAQRRIQQSSTVDLTKGSSASLFPFEKFDVVTHSMLRKYDSGVKMIEISKMVAEILKDRPSWHRDCRCIDIIHVIRTGNGGTIELIYMQTYAPTTLAAPLDLGRYYTSGLEDGSLVVAHYMGFNKA